MEDKVRCFGALEAWRGWLARAWLTAPVLLPQVKLLSSDTQTFEVDTEVARQSVTIQNTIEGAWGPARGMGALRGAMGA